MREPMTDLVCELVVSLDGSARGSSKLATDPYARELVMPFDRPARIE